MTAMPSATNAEKKHEWTEQLRVTEVSRYSKPAAQASHIDILHRASFRLKEGWRWLERKRSQQLSSRRLRLAETISLGDKRSVSIIQVDGAQYLIGCSTGNVQLLAILDKQDLRRTGLSEPERPS